jgi:formiminoglutamase
MSDFDELLNLLEPINPDLITEDEGFRDGQIGKLAQLYVQQLPDWTDADYVIVGCNEYRGAGMIKGEWHAADTIRKAFYSLYSWHESIRFVDIGNIRRGATLLDTYAAIRVVVQEILQAGKRVIIIGGSHDISLAQYKAYAGRREIIELANIDARINIDIDSPQRSENFLMELLTGEPNFVKHYHHIGFQSYFVHPRMLETMDRLRFDCYRVGHVKTEITEMEPAIRGCRMVSFDMEAMAHAFAPGAAISPNGFTGEEACILARYAGMSDLVDSIGIYGYHPHKDQEGLTALQIAQMLWYVLDGRYKVSQDTNPSNRDAFNEYAVLFGDIESVFLQSKRTGRWWMQLPDSRFIPCSRRDYELASNNEIPERWLRAQERP